MTHPWPIPVTPLAPVTCGSTTWRWQGRVGVTVVVKATFGMVHEASARLVAPAAIVREDRYRAESGSLEAASDLAPYLPSTGVLVSGAAHAGAGQKETAMTVRLGIYRDGPLLDKLLYVLGYRPPESPSSPWPFDTVPIVYERAYGGPGVEDNPVGTGAAPGSYLPNVIDPQSPLRPSGFGPVARHWGPRRRLLAGADPQAIDAPVAEIPPDLDWAYFHAAPADQQIDLLQGDEWIVLDGMHPSLPHLTSRLPSALAHAYWQLSSPSGPGPGHVLELSPDTLLITPATQLCSVVWRGHVLLKEADDVARMAVTAGVETAGYPLAAKLREALEQCVPEEEEEQTGSLAGVLASALPFQPRDTPPPASFSAPEARRPKATPGETQSVVVKRPRRALPWKGETLDSLPRIYDIEDEGTQTAAADPLSAKPIAPFALPEPGERPGLSTTIPGAPWSRRSPKVTPPAEPVADPSTIERAPVEPAPPPAPAPPSPPPASPAPPPPTKAASANRDDVVAACAEGRPLDGMDLSGADLHDLDLQGRSLVGATLSRAVLTGARLDGATLAGADLTGASLSGASFKGASLEDAVLKDAQGEGVAFDEARMAKMSAEGASLPKSSFDGAIAEGASFERATLTEATFRAAVLSRANLQRASCARADFSRADLSEADLGRVDAEEAELRGANLDGANLRKARLAGASLAEATLRKAWVDEADLGRARLTRADLEGASLRGAVLKGAVLARAKLEGADLTGADLEDAAGVGASKPKAGS